MWRRQEQRSVVLAERFRLSVVAEGTRGENLLLWVVGSVGLPRTQQRNQGQV